MRLRILVAAVFLVAVIGISRLIFAWPSGQTSALAYTECPFIGPARVRILEGIAAEDTLPVRMHEAEHAAQCDSLGPLRYRVRNLTGGGRLSLEAPGYCAGAAARLKQGGDSGRVRERLYDDAVAAFSTMLDSAAVLAALRAACPGIAAP